jgi:predicted Zn-ribbon and HTH transcriptional regulator
MFTKSKFTPAHQQLSSLKNKKVVQNVRCAVQNVHCVHHVSQKIVYKNVYEILIQPAHKKSALYYEKQKSLKTGAKCALCSSF